MDSIVLMGDFNSILSCLWDLIPHVLPLALPFMGVVFGIKWLLSFMFHF